MKVEENRINQKLKIFRNKNVIIETVGDYKLRFELYNIQLYFNNKNGLLHITDYTKKNKIVVNITQICYINLENRILKIQLDELSIIIRDISWRHRWKI
mgnify:CR=1 FL=1